MSSARALGDLSFTADQREWREVRRYLNRNRPELTRAAAALYSDALSVADTLLMSIPAWIPVQPLRLEHVRLHWDPSAEPAGLTGAEPQSEGVRPLRDTRERFVTYADAVGALDRPRLFEDRASYRMLDVDLAAAGQISFARGSYFDVINISEAVAHEFAAAVLGGRALSLEELPFRSLIGNPFDLTQRPLMVAVSTLTLRRDRRSGHASFVLHWRDPQRVASGGGLFQVMPVGMFQPTSASPCDERSDFDLWRGLVREYSEEFLGSPERDGGDGSYEAWPFFQAMDEARRTGAIRIHCLGLGLDPLTLVADVLMAAVFDDDAFDDLLGSFGEDNEEGQIVTAEGQGFAFDAKGVEPTAKPMQPAGAAVVALAWQNRQALLHN